MIFGQCRDIITTKNDFEIFKVKLFFKLETWFSIILNLFKIIFWGEYLLARQFCSLKNESHVIFLHELLKKEKKSRTTEKTKTFYTKCKKRTERWKVIILTKKKIWKMIFKKLQKLISKSNAQDNLCKKTEIFYDKNWSLKQQLN